MKLIRPPATATALSLLFLLPASICAISDQVGQRCSLANNRLQAGSYQFTGDCDSQTFCTSNGTCASKGCRKDIFPFGYGVDDDLPPLCPNDQFCPDEGDACQALLPVGSLCQLNRDDECEAPSNFNELKDDKYGTNVNGSVCLNYQCAWANVTLGQSCVVENVPYIVYGPNDQESIDIVSRGNCKIGLYCDSQQLVCISQKPFGQSCDADKECQSFNCLSSGTCGHDINAAVHVGAWAYAIVGIGIIGGMVGTLVALFFLHQKQREQAREKRMQYWREQNAFRQNIMHMRDTARTSIFSLPANSRLSSHPQEHEHEKDRGVGPSNQSTVYTGSSSGSEDAHTSNPMLLSSQGRASRLRDTVYAEDGSVEGSEREDGETEGLRHRRL